MNIVIDVADWEDKVKRNEVTVKSAEEIVELARKGLKSSDITTVMLISQLWGLLEDDKVRQPKANLYYGGMDNIHKILRAENRRVKIGDLTFIYHKFIGPGDNEDSSYVESASKAGMARARKNLRERVIKYIKSQILILLDGKQDWIAELELLKSAIDEIVVEMSG